jgi:hypothetical protein
VVGLGEYSGCVGDTRRRLVQHVAWWSLTTVMHLVLLIGARLGIEESVGLQVEGCGWCLAMLLVSSRCGSHVVVVLTNASMFGSNKGCREKALVVLFHPICHSAYCPVVIELATDQFRIFMAAYPWTGA